MTKRSFEDIDRWAIVIERIIARVLSCVAVFFGVALTVLALTAWMGTRFSVVQLVMMGGVGVLLIGFGAFAWRVTRWASVSLGVFFAWTTSGMLRALSTIYPLPDDAVSLVGALTSVGFIVVVTVASWGAVCFGILAGYRWWAQRNSARSVRK